MKIIIAPDSFKGSLTSAEAGEAIAAGIKEILPECQIQAIKAADGGEGTIMALMEVLGGRIQEAEVHDPLMRPIKAIYGISEDGTTAMIEMSAASGLCLLREEEMNPSVTTTFGTGELICDAFRNGCRHFLVGIGGSATNDAGTGMLSALGVRFYDSHGMLLHGTGESLKNITYIDTAGIPAGMLDADFTIACDVDSPFCGPEGAAYVFAPQKGADADMVKRLDQGMESFASVTLRQTGYDMQKAEGAGAAGGLGGAFAAFLGGKLVSGSEMILEAAGFDRLLKDADIVITGEGRIDRQTSKGKLPYRVLMHASSYGIPVIAVAGSVSTEDNPGFAAVLPVVQGPCSLAEAMDRHTAYNNIRRTAVQIANLISLPTKRGTGHHNKKAATSL